MRYPIDDDKMILLVLVVALVQTALGIAFSHMIGGFRW